MAVQKCVVCSKPILEEDPVVFGNGDCIHAACWRTLSSQDAIRESRRRIRESRELLDRPSTEWKPKNDRDSNGWPICPTCEQPLRPGEGAKRGGAYMLHLNCSESPA
jgi:hypothetical protein